MKIKSMMKTFNTFIKKVFDEMLTEATFLAFKNLERNGQKPGVGDFQNELNYLIKHIMKEKIELLGVYLKKMIYCLILLFGDKKNFNF